MNNMNEQDHRRDTREELASRHLVEIKPYLVTIIEENAGILARNRPNGRRAYGTRDLKRWARFRGKPLLVGNP